MSLPNRGFLECPSLRVILQISGSVLADVTLFVSEEEHLNAIYNIFRIAKCHKLQKLALQESLSGRLPSTNNQP